MNSELKTIKERLLDLCNEIQVSKAYFSQEIGKNRQFIDKITGEIGSDVLRQIYLRFPSVNVLWIITGKGDMLLQKSDETLHSSDASLLLRMLNKEREKIDKLEENNKNLMREKEELKDNINQLNIENLKLKQQLGVEVSPSIKDAI